jgi:hypothetical protein
MTQSGHRHPFNDLSLEAKIDPFQAAAQRLAV